MSLIPLAVIAYCVTSACVVEALQWLIVWRTSGFQVGGAGRALPARVRRHGSPTSRLAARLLHPRPVCPPHPLTQTLQALKANLSKHVRAVDEAKEGAAGAAGSKDSSGPKSLRKKEQRLANWRTEAAKQMAKYNTQSGIIVSTSAGPAGARRARLASRRRLLLLLPFVRRRGTPRALTSAPRPHHCTPPATPSTRAADGLHDRHLQAHEPTVCRRGPRGAPAVPAAGLPAARHAPRPHWRRPLRLLRGARRLLACGTGRRLASWPAGRRWLGSLCDSAGVPVPA